MVYYGGFVQKGNQGEQDLGMFYKLMKAHGIDVTVIDCTQGNHYLKDFIGNCGTCTQGDHLAGVNLASIDYVILSEAGSNTSSFLSDCRAVYKRVTDHNPQAKKIYINHIYSVFKNHTNILSNLKRLYNEDNVTIINCGQLAYDIYTGKVRVPGGSLSYSDKYTFVNHTSDDSHHPNPLMGYIMTQMVYSALTGEDAIYNDYATLVKGCFYGSGSVAYSSYYSKYYTTPAALPFTTVIDSSAEMKGIQQLIPGYINYFDGGGNPPTPDPDPDPDPKPETISTAKDFENYMRNYASSEKGTMTISNDIDLSGVKLYSVPSFEGVLDGGGHSLRNMKITDPLFATSSGLIKNIVIDSSCTLEPNSSTTYSAIFVGENSGTISECTSRASIQVSGGSWGTSNFIAPFAACNSGLVEQCLNSGQIDFQPSSFSGSITAGGIIAYGMKGGIVRNCTNTAKINVTPSSASGNQAVRLGGLAGGNASTCFLGCINSGDVYTNITFTALRIGGLLGWQDAVDDGKNYNIMEDCTVSCTVTGGCWESGKVPQWTGGNDVMASGAMVVGRMSGQSGKSSYLYYGTAEKPVKISGRVVCNNPQHSKSQDITPENFKSYVCGGGSATNYAGDPSKPTLWQVWNAVYHTPSPSKTRGSIR